ncbi:DNA repair protein RadC [Bacteroides sp. OttesenSCG-928-E20]|nr:DNA repair protein RadC [Bacteroides sp. OttesenSCG-928-E20]MDL2304432.1 DNA repair protein RadC [Bacteroides sp. OttesenSCG-928-D19]
MENHPKQKLNINQWAEEDRPREKMLQKGIDALSDAELLAILIGSGNKNETAVELMRRVLMSCDNNLNELGKWDHTNFSAFNGIGTAKSTTIMAALELGKRRKTQEVKERVQIVSSVNVYNIFHPLLCDAVQEEFWILLLNQAHKVIKSTRISTGGIDGTYADVRTILREALLERATAIVLCHNHPSGNPTPSINDRKLTTNIQQAAKTMNICLIDHVIVCDGKFYSFADEGLI